MTAYKELQTRFKRTQNAVADDNVTALLDQAVLTPAGYPVIVAQVDVRDPGMLRNFWDVVRSRMDAPGAAVLIGVKDDRPILLAAGSDEEMCIRDRNRSSFL